MNPAMMLMGIFGSRCQVVVVGFWSVMLAPFAFTPAVVHGVQLALVGMAALKALIALASVMRPSA